MVSRKSAYAEMKKATLLLLIGSSLISCQKHPPHQKLTIKESGILGHAAYKEIDRIGLHDNPEDLYSRYEYIMFNMHQNICVLFVPVRHKFYKPTQLNSIYCFDRRTSRLLEHHVS